VTSLTPQQVHRVLLSQRVGSTRAVRSTYHCSAWVHCDPLIT